MILPIPILSLLKQPLLWRCIGFLSSVTGLLCYALSSSFKHLFGKWNLLKIILNGVWSVIMCSVVLLAKKWKLSRSLTLKARVGFLVLMITSVYSFFYDKAVNGKPDVLGLISCAAFALMSFSLSRQIDLGFEVDLLNFFLGCFVVQLMKINLMLASIGGVFSYFLIILRSSLDSQQEVGTVVATATNHVAIEIDTSNRLEIGANIGINNGFQSEFNNHRQELPSLRKRHLVTTIPDLVYLKNANQRSADDAMYIQAEFREHILKDLKEFQFSNPEAEARKIVAAMKIQHAFRNYKTRRNMAVAATRIQHAFHAWKIRKESLKIRQQTVKIQAAFRGFQVREKYSKILWSIGVIDKAIIHWRFKRRGLRGLYMNPVQEMKDQRWENEIEDEMQAKEHVIKFVVQARSKNRMKIIDT